MRWSVVIPTYERREMVLRTVAALDRQLQRDFEVIAVDDGSTDGTAAALSALRAGFPLTVLEQHNQGAAQARNAGAAVAGELLLFLDDDMEAHPALLLEHERSRAEGAHVVLGDLPLHPDAPRNVLCRGVGEWARRRRERLIAADEIPLRDFITGQMSISRDLFERLGRFDVSFTRDGLYGGEDVDFGYRVLEAGCRVAFNPKAMSYQYYDVDPADFLQRAYETGRSDLEVVVKHPEQAGHVEAGPHLNTLLGRVLLAAFVLAPATLSRPLRAVVARLVRSGRDSSRLQAVFLSVRAMEYRRGVRDARRGLATGGAIVLTYHAIAELSKDPALEQYGVPPARFAQQLDALRRAGVHFVDLQALLGALRGERRLPARAALVTFDDGYADLLSAALPVLTERGIPAVAFAVTGLIGATNEWDREIGARTMPLLDEDGLRAVSRSGVEIGSHGVTHCRMAGLGETELRSELDDSAARLTALGLPRPRVVSYPYGVVDPTVAAAAHRAGYEAGFTVRSGIVRRDSPRFALPRVEVLASDTPTRLRIKVATAGWPDPVRARLLSFLRIQR
jgi:peptidoglycan/xylan/chitin deacetylase (PgdA/CDA1 family)/GT2 family glycosyltransferase